MRRSKCLVIPGSSGDWKDIDLGKLDISAGTIRKRAENYAAVIEYLKNVRDVYEYVEIGIFMKIPFSNKKLYCLTGPVFAAILLHEYKLAEQIIDKWGRIDNVGVIFSDKLKEPDYHFYDKYIYIDQLFLYDMDIPSSLLLKMPSAIGFEFVPEHNVIDNNLTSILDDSFRRPSPFSFEEAIGKQPYAERYNKLKKKCPEIFHELFLELVISEEIWDEVAICGTLNEVQDLCRIMYREFGEVPRFSFAFFSCEASALCTSLIWGTISDDECKRYIVDARKAMGLLVGSEEFFCLFVKTLLNVLYLLDNIDTYYMWGSTKELEELVTSCREKLIKLLKQGLRKSGEEKIRFQDMILYHCIGERIDPGVETFFEYTFSVERYLSYVTGFMKTYKKYTGRKIIMDREDPVFVMFQEKICNLPFDGYNTLQMMEEANVFSGEKEWDRIKLEHMKDFMVEVSWE